MFGRRVAAAFALAVALSLAVPVVAQDAGDAGSKSSSAAVGDLQKRMRSDPQMMNEIEALSSNPDVQAILNDPAILDALNRGDLVAVLTNPKVAKLTENPAVRDIARQLEEK
jgi:hypothetical protein